MELAPLALIARLAALVPPPKRHLVRYFGVLSSHSSLRDQVVPASTAPPASPAEPDKAKKTSRYIRWSELLRRVFGIEILCKKCKAPLRLIALIKSEDTAKKILDAMHLPSELGPAHPTPAPRGFAAPVAKLHPARPPPGSPGVEGGEEQAGESWLN